MIHFLPTEFDARTAALIAGYAGDVRQPVRCSEPLVETTIIDSPHGSVVSLVNWPGRPIDDLQVRITVKLPTGSVSLASGGDVSSRQTDSGMVYTFDCDTADALIFRK